MNSSNKVLTWFKNVPHNFLKGLVKCWKGFVEFLRKFVVSLKRRPCNIILIMLLVSFLVYSLNMTSISATTGNLGGSTQLGGKDSKFIVPLGLSSFLTYLCSILAFVCFFNAFPKRQATKKPMLVLLYVMFALVIIFDLLYIMRIAQGLSGISAENQLVAEKTRSIMIAHIVLYIVSTALLALLPIYTKLLRMINTSIEVAGNENMGTIDVEED